MRECKSMKIYAAITSEQAYKLPLWYSVFSKNDYHLELSKRYFVESVDKEVVHKLSYS